MLTGFHNNIMRTTIKIMATRKIELGATGETVRYNIRMLRLAKGLTLDDLSERLARFQRPMSKATLSQVETGGRRVDVDDLMAFSRALDVTPNTLLLPPDRGNGENSEVQLTAFDWRRISDVLAWARGDTPLDWPERPEHVDPQKYEEWAQFVFQNSLHTVPNLEKMGRPPNLRHPSGFTIYFPETQPVEMSTSAKWLEASAETSDVE